MAGDGNPGRIDDVAFYTHLRGRIEHEDTLIANRLAWLMASESFLFTAYAIVLNGLPSVLGDHRRLIPVIAILGVVSSVLILAGILAAIRAIGWLKEQCRARIPDEAALGLPPIHAPRPIVMGGMLAPVALPPAFILVWLYLLAS